MSAAASTQPKLNKRATETDQRLNRLYDAIESGVADLSDNGLKERIAGLKAPGAEEVGGQVAIAQTEPALAPEAGQFLHHGPALSHDAPAGLPIVHAGQRVGDRVQVRTDMEAVENRVVTHVDDRRDGGRGDDADEAGKHTGGSDAAAEGDEHGASIEGATPGAGRPARVAQPGSDAPLLRSAPGHHGM